MPRPREEVEAIIVGIRQRLRARFGARAPMRVVQSAIDGAIARAALEDVEAALNSMKVEDLLVASEINAGRADVEELAELVDSVLPSPSAFG